MSGKCAVVLLLFISVIHGGLTSLFTTEQSGYGTYYGANNGIGLACSIYPTPSFFSGLTPVAINAPQWTGSMACGMCIQVTGNGVGSGSNPITGTFNAVVADECPGCASGSLDLAKNGDGSWDISWYAIDCPVSGYLQYMFQGSNSYYMKLQVRNHRIPVNAVQFEANGKWYTGSRTSDNFFVVSSYPYPVTFPLTIQVQGIDNNWVTDTVPSLSSSPMNGGKNVQLGTIQSAAAVAANYSSFTSAPTTSGSLDNALVAIVVVSGLVILTAIIVGIVLLARVHRVQLENESKP